MLQTIEYGNNMEHEKNVNNCNQVSIEVVRITVSSFNT